MNKCPTCKNNLETRKYIVDYHGPMGTARKVTESFCAYCEWKGTTGPGKQLRDLIKEHNDEK